MENNTQKTNFMDTDIEEDIPDDSLYRSFDNDPNMLSKWYPKIQKCGIPTPKTLILKVPENIFTKKISEKAHLVSRGMNRSKG